MSNFIEVHNKLINVNSIRKVIFVSDDIYLGLFPKGENGELAIDYVDFTYAQIELVSGEKIELSIDLYHPEYGQSEDDWARYNRAFINMSWGYLKEALGQIKRVTGYEYRYL